MIAAPAAASLYDLTFEEVGAWLIASGGKAVHARELWRRLYRDPSGAGSPLPLAVVERVAAALAAAAPQVALETASGDGFTRKYLLRLADGTTVETVLMRFRGRATACLSTQAGCAMGCVFCATGQMGFSRQLSAGEIVSQAVHVARVLSGDGERLRNIVLMGMGEPLHNYDAVMRAVSILHDPRGLAVSGRRITLSTVGLVPGILRLADEGHPVELAVSLHAATDEERRAMIPAARRWPLAELMAACDYYAAKRDREIFFEWTLVEGTNDGPEQARALAALLCGRRVHVNLIPLNPTAGYEGRAARPESATRFQEILRAAGIPSTVRQRRGIDIAAGCGQLAAELAEK